jgi:hypothetical protein
LPTCSPRTGGPRAPVEKSASASARRSTLPLVERGDLRPVLVDAGDDMAEMPKSSN